MSDKPISPLRQRMIDDMTARRFKEKVQKDYVRHVRTFAAFLGQSTDKATKEDLRRFQSHLARLFCRLFLEGLAALHAAGRLAFFVDLAPLADKRAFDAELAPLRRSEWVVYAKRPFAGPKAVFAYLARYTHRVAISNSRLMALDDKGVTFKWKDYRIKGRDRLRTMTLDAAEFIRRFLLHVLPSRFHRIRHMWTASWQAVFDALIALVGCGHMSGLLVRYRTAGPDDIRQSWSLSLRRARSSWRMSGCPGLSLRPCRSSRRCACQSLRN